MTELPSQIGARYEVLERLGHGGMAVVYRVRDSSRAGELALKQLSVPADPSRARDLTALFEREFYTLAQLSHPSVIEAYDFGLDPSGPYYTMELLTGGDLSERAPVQPSEACRLFAQVCSSLCVLHARRLVHRDISPRNVRFTGDGRAKLIDFGALLDMGPCSQTIGTPAFTAPEVVQQVAVDARTDLFSLGATLYYALTKRPPFPVRAFSDLRAAWRDEVVPPSRLVRDVPPALDALVLSLLRIDPDLRPHSTFEVMQRLAAIAGVPQAELQLHSQAYLTTPLLVGREPELRRLRKQLRKALAGHGGGLLFEGAPGVGRSRLLDACVLEAKTVGATVLRVAGAAASQPFSGIHALASQLLEALPAPARRSAAASGVSELLLTEAGAVLPVERLAADRARSLAGLLAWLAGICREQPVVIAVDDLDRIDEASLALLASLAHMAADARLLILLSAGLETSTAAPVALGILRNHFPSSRLAPLTRTQIEMLFTSVFGTTPHIALLSARVHQLAEGNPRESLVLAQQLLDSGRIRYADGQWVLPSELTLHDLPASLEEAFRKRIALLPPLALRLAQTQSLALGGPWTRADYADLAAAEVDQLDAALAALLKNGLLSTDGRAYTMIGQPLQRAGLTSQLTADEIARRHLALAAWCARAGRSPVIEAHHRLLGGEHIRALDRYAELFGGDSDSSDAGERAGLEPIELATCLEHAFECAVAIGRPLRQCHELARLLTSISVITHARFHRKYSPAWLRQLEHDSGLTEYRALGSLEAGPRLMTALTKASQRYEATPAAERVYRVDEAIKYLARYVVMSIAIGSRTRDLRLLASLPALLEPFSSLSPVLHALWQDALMVNELAYEARVDRARERAVEVYEKLGTASGDQLKYVEEIRFAIAYGLAMIDTVLGRASVDWWLAILDRDVRQRAGAEYLRSLACVWSGDTEGAKRHRKQADVYALQVSGVQIFGMPIHAELNAYGTVGDLAGVRRVMDQVSQLAAAEPNWLPTQHVAAGWYQLLRGDARSGLVEFEKSIASNHPEQVDPPPCFNTWAFAAVGCMSALVELGRAEEARELGLAAAKRSRDQEANWTIYIESEIALAESALGQHGAAVARMDALLAQASERLDLRRQMLNQMRARIAIAAGDVPNAVRFADLATRDVRTGEHKLQPRHGAMLDAARRAGIDLGLAPSGFESSVLGHTRDDRHALAARAAFALQQVSPREKPQRILELVCEAAGARGGHLYAADDADLARVASLHVDTEAVLDAFASGYFQQQREDALCDDAVTEVSAGVTEEPSVGSWTSPSGVSYRLLALTQLVDGDLTLTGLAALVMAPGRALSPQTHVLARALAGELAASTSGG